MTEAPWRPMSEAPRDGTVIIVAYSDFSGASPYAFDEERNMWTLYDPDRWGSDYSEGFDSLKEYGWVPVPLVRKDKP
ncbi:MAG: hypothetical protein C5B60_04135 [Chloroflexi bacterium]|nr:MAG: hypothetical protein C5B60_04135 [Chloroflexota bacterium]